MSWKVTVVNDICKQKGSLTLVATPIGNLKDITFRALEALKEAQILVCEDTRVTRKLLTHFGVHPQELWIYHEHNAPTQRPKIIDALMEGKKIALVCDAGTPLISDPGYKLVRDLQDVGLRVSATPGPCAAIMALTLSGLPTDQFFFAGFVPRKSSARQTFFTNLANIPGTLIFYDSPRRFMATLQDLYTSLGEREIAFGRELTKLFEDVQRGSLKGFLEREDLANLKGELVLLVGPGHEKTPCEEDIRAFLATCLETHSLKDAVAQTCQHFERSRQDIYAWALEIRRNQDKA